MEEGYDVVPATVEDTDKIVIFLRQHFYPHEPMNKALGAPPERPINAIFSLQFLPEGMSLLAVSRNSRKLLGVCINGEEKLCGETPPKKEMKVDNEAYIKINDIIEKVIDDVDLWKLTGAERVLHIHVLAVDPVTRGRGIGRALMESSRNIARYARYPQLCVLCTSHFTARISHDMGMKKVYSLAYKDYKDENGTAIILPSNPHTEIVMFVQKLNSET